MKSNAYLHFNGNCAEALQYYESRLGGKVLSRSLYGDSPAAPHAPAGWSGKILHARLQLGDAVLMVSDSPGTTGAYTGFALCLSTETEDEAKRLFAAIADGGKVTMPMGPTFFARQFGMGSDRFGVPWMVICEPPR